MTPFHQVLANNAIANITNFTVWFALTFWVYIETQSVFATGMIAGIYLVLTAAFAIWFGSLVDHHRKKRVMMGSSLVSMTLYAVAFAVHQAAPEGSLSDVASPFLWMLIVLVMLGVIAGNIRSIALPTLVTALVPEDRRDRANGLVGMVTGIGFLTTSVISGFLVAWSGMVGTLLFAIGLSALVFIHLRFVALNEPAPTASEAGEHARGRIDLPGTLAVIAAVPGLFALIFFTTFNNFLGGVFMALMDAYGLSLMAVQQWGLFWGATSVAFILGGLAISRVGLGRNPMRTLMIVNLIVWTASALFTAYPSIILLGVGTVVWMFFGPFAEAAEQTTLQKAVPYERQGRVFGFAHSIELAASPLTAFLIGPLTQFIVIPFMTDGAGADAIGDWFGRGPDRGIALVFTVSGVVGILITLLAFNSRYYRQLSKAYARPAEDAAGA